MRSKALVVHLAKHKFNIDKPNLDIKMFHWLLFNTPEIAAQSPAQVSG